MLLHVVNLALVIVGLLNVVVEAGVHHRCQHSIKLPEPRTTTTTTSRSSFRDRSRRALNMTRNVHVPQRRPLPRGLKLTVDTVLTVLCPEQSKGNARKRGDCATREAIGKQMDTLNQAYNLHSIGFRLREVRYVYHDGWFRTSVGRETVSADAQSMMETLRVGDRRTLNVVYKSLEDDGILGMTVRLPAEMNAWQLWSDIVMIERGTLGETGNPLFKGFTEGKTVIHEVGHWLGLYHPMRYFCDESDMRFGIPDDTPAALNVDNESCAAPLDTCPNSPGKDPVHNYMSYSVDSCLREFTPGQVKMMMTAYQRYRS